MENHFEKNHGRLRRNDWKWNPEIDNLLNFYSQKFCECGCGKKLHPTRKQIRDSMSKRKPLRVLKGHHNRLPEAKKWLLSGENHPNTKRRGELWPGWKGGKKKRTDYGKSWETARRHSLKKYNYTCQVCGKNQKERRIDIHHKIPFKNFSESKEANNQSNLIALCYKCHQVEEWKLRAKEKQGELLEHPEWDNQQPS